MVFDLELLKTRRKAGETQGVDDEDSEAIKLLVNNVYSILVIVGQVVEWVLMYYCVSDRKGCPAAGDETKVSLPIPRRSGWKTPEFGFWVRGSAKPPSTCLAMAYS